MNRSWQHRHRYAGAVLSILASTLRLALARWPVLLAWYLAGWLARYLVIEVASTLGAQSALLGFLVMPLATLARLASFVGMFLALRAVMPSFSDLEGRGLDAIDRTTTTAKPGRVYDILLASILPFFAFYAAWKFLAEDVAQYSSRSLEKIDFFAGEDATGAVLNLQADALTISIIVVAFVGRFLLKRHQAALPRWTAFVTVYLEAVWVYLTISIISLYSDMFTAWVSSRAAVVAVADLRAAVSAWFAPLGWAWDGIEWVLGQAGGVLLLPLAWLALAGVVYGRALAAEKIRYRPGGRYYARALSRVTALPTGVLRRLRDVGNDVVGRWKPLSNALVLMWRAGVVPMGLYVHAYTVIDASSAWAFLGVVQVVGPHELERWWVHLADIYFFGIDVLLEPLRICLIAAGYDFCLRRLEERRENLAGADPAPAEHAVSGPG
jgi:hypothetical protein